MEHIDIPMDENTTVAQALEFGRKNRHLETFEIKDKKEKDMSDEPKTVFTGSNEDLKHISAKQVCDAAKTHEPIKSYPLNEGETPKTMAKPGQEKTAVYELEDGRKKSETHTKEEDDALFVDGSRLLKFIDSVKQLGLILEDINVWEIKEAFIKGKEIKTISDIINIHAKWRDSMKEIALAMKADVKNQEDALIRTKDNVKLLHEFQHEHAKIEKMNGALKGLVELCDRLEKHRASGLLDAVKEIMK